jgi:DNA-binding CsgD family transcriptional regulator
MAIARDITERKEDETRIRHLNTVLRAISNVNQLITKEKKRDELIQKVCSKLQETCGYYNVWIVHIDNSGKLADCAEAGLGDKFLPMLSQLKRGEFFHYCRRALRQAGVLVNEDPRSNCPTCPMSSLYHGRGSMTVRLECKGEVHGLVTASMPKEFVTDKEAQELFKEIADGISSALHSLEVEDERKQAEKASKIRKAELEVKTKNLEETNTALRVLLRQREEDKAELESNVLSNVKQLVIPFIDKLKGSKLETNQMRYVDVLESNLYEITSPFSRNLSSKDLGLSPSQLRVADLVRSGKSTKEIADLLNLSSRTVETHRKHIRKKIGVKKKRTNLRSLLSSMR